MQITHIDGSVSDTEKLNDIDTLALEKAEELKNLFAQYKIPFVLRFNLPKDRFCGAISLISDNEQPKECLDSLMQDSIAFFERFTNGSRFVLMDEEAFKELGPVESPADEHFLS